MTRLPGNQQLWSLKDRQSPAEYQDKELRGGAGWIAAVELRRHRTRLGDGGLQTRGAEVTEVAEVFLVACHVVPPALLPSSVAIRTTQPSPEQDSNVRTARTREAAMKLKLD